MSRRPLIAGNWKMHNGDASGVELAKAIAAAAPEYSHVDFVVSTPATVLSAVAETVKGSGVGVAAQNMHWEAKGAFTGEISADMVKAAGAEWVLIGHSERRQYFGETDEQVALKTAAAQAANIQPIVCIGETLEEREADRTFEVVERQLAAVIATLQERPGFAAIAYEPVWAIGTGKVASPAQAQEVHAAIRSQLKDTSGELSAKTRILYGGSVKPDNAVELLGCDDIDGALIGGASLLADSFLGIAKGAPKA